MSLPLGSSNCCWNRVLVILHVVHVKSTHFTSLYVASCRGLALPWAKSVIQMLQHLSFKTNFCCLGAFLRYICPVDVRAGRTFGPAPLHPMSTTVNTHTCPCQYREDGLFTARVPYWQISLDFFDLFSLQQKWYAACFISLFDFSCKSSKLAAFKNRGPY